MTRPSGYRGPLDPGRDRDQVMVDPVAQNLIAEIVQLHDDLCRKLDKDVHQAGMGPVSPAAGFVTGTGERDRMLIAADAVKYAEAEQTRVLKAARQRLRRDRQWYLDATGVPCTDPAHHHTPMDVGESIGYRNDGQRRVG